MSKRTEKHTLYGNILFMLVEWMLTLSTIIHAGHIDIDGTTPRLFLKLITLTSIIGRRTKTFHDDDNLSSLKRNRQQGINSSI
jgi:hypothetical protein